MSWVAVAAAVHIPDAIKTILKFYFYFSKSIFLLSRENITRFALIFSGLGCRRLFCFYGSSAKGKKPKQVGHSGWPEDVGSDSLMNMLLPVFSWLGRRAGSTIGPNGGLLMFAAAAQLQRLSSPTNLSFFLSIGLGSVHQSFGGGADGEAGRLARCPGRRREERDGAR